MGLLSEEFKPTAGGVDGLTLDSILLHDLRSTFEGTVSSFTSYGRLVFSKAVFVVLVVDWVVLAGNGAEVFMHGTSGCFSGWVFI